MRRPKLLPIPSVLILLKEGTNASHVLASLHHLPLAPKERFSNIISHAVLGFSVCLFGVFCKSGVNSNRENLMSDF